MSHNGLVGWFLWFTDQFFLVYRPVFYNKPSTFQNQWFSTLNGLVFLIYRLVFLILLLSKFLKFWLFNTSQSVFDDFLNPWLECSMLVGFKQPDQSSSLFLDGCPLLPSTNLRTQTCTILSTNLRTQTCTPLLAQVNASIGQAARK
jgi:hypothetical protein